MNTTTQMSSQQVAIIKLNKWVQRGTAKLKTTRPYSNRIILEMETQNMYNIITERGC